MAIIRTDGSILNKELLPRHRRFPTELWVQPPAAARRILKAAEKLFAERGPERTRMEDIARVARVTKPLLYYYFHSKEQLHRATLKMLFGTKRESMKKSTLTRPRDQLLDYVNGYFDFVLIHPTYPRLMYREMMSLGPALAWIVDEHYRWLFSRLKAIVREGIRQGDFCNVDPEQMVLTVIGVTSFYFFSAPLHGKLLGIDPLAPSRVEQRRRAVLDFLEKGLFLPQRKRRLGRDAPE